MVEEDFLDFFSITMESLLFTYNDENMPYAFWASLSCIITFLFLQYVRENDEIGPFQAKSRFLKGKPKPLSCYLKEAIPVREKKKTLMEFQ